MYRIHFLLIPLFLFFLGCQSAQKDPASTAPKYSFQVIRFDSAYFAMDTLQTVYSIKKLIAQYPNFGDDYFSKIIMVNPLKDTAAVKAFYRSYLPIFKASQKTDAIKKEKANLEDAFKHLHFYFPNYALVNKVILFIGPLESYGNIVTKDALALGLQMYLGANSDWYFSERIQTIYPPYLSRRFAPAYIAVNSVQNILNDIAPEKTNGVLIHQMIEAGKRQYIINACLPQTPDSIRMGYTQLQLNSLDQSASKIWAYILHEKLAYSTSPTDIRSIMQDGAYSDVFGESIPANTGKYIGFKIVEAFMHQKAQKGITMEALLNTPADKILEMAAYAP